LKEFLICVDIAKYINFVKLTAVLNKELKSEEAPEALLQNLSCWSDAGRGA